MPRCAPAFLVALLAAGCGGVALRVGRPPATRPGALSIEETAIARCVRAVPGQGSPYREALPGPVTDPELRAYLERLPADVRRTAVAAGIEPLLARVLRERERGTSLELIRMRQELDVRVASLGPQLMAMEFEAECNIALLQRTLREHDDEESQRQLVLAIASLVASAGFGLAAAIWDIANEHTDMPAVPDGPLATAIVGVVPTTVLAAAALSPVPREVSIGHEHNLLRPIERGDDRDLLYPTFVFRLLTAPMPGGAPTPRDELFDRWNELIADAGSSSDRDLVRALLFGEGGIYDRATTELRQHLYEELEATLDSLARHIDLLSRTLVTALSTPEAESTAQGHAGRSGDALEMRR
jgi:hypothetical protein